MTLCFVFTYGFIKLFWFRKLIKMEYSSDVETTWFELLWMVWTTTLKFETKMVTNIKLWTYHKCKTKHNNAKTEFWIWNLMIINVCQKIWIWSLTSRCIDIRHCECWIWPGERLLAHAVPSANRLQQLKPELKHYLGRFNSPGARGSARRSNKFSEFGFFIT